MVAALAAVQLVARAAACTVQAAAEVQAAGWEAALSAAQFPDWNSARVVTRSAGKTADLAAGRAVSLVAGKLAALAAEPSAALAQEPPAALTPG